MGISKLVKAVIESPVELKTFCVNGKHEFYLQVGNKVILQSDSQYGSKNIAINEGIDLINDFRTGNFEDKGSYIPN